MKTGLNTDQIKKTLSVTMLPHELDDAMPLIEQINTLKKEKGILILGHNYMTPDVYHGVSDYIGDSLGLARKAANTPAPIILFNGVHFMAETAKICNPSKKVLIADPEAGCSLAESITGKDVQRLKDKYPGVPVVTYVNCSAEVKAYTDICCTSANALQVVESFTGHDTIIFLPDEYLARNIQQQTKKKIISWEQGKCMVHEQYTAEDLQHARKQFPELMIVSHPECNTDVTGASDFAGSTSQMGDFIEKDSRQNIMLVTECSMADNLRVRFPERNFISTCHTCPHMKKITLQKVYDAIVNEQFEVEVPEDIINKAFQSVDRMLKLG